MMRKTTLLLSFLACQAFIAGAQDRQMSGNPVFEGWYADPEAIVYGRTCWIYPTTSDLYELQTHFDAFSSKDLVGRSIRMC